MKLNPCERLNQASPHRGDDITSIGNLQRQFKHIYVASNDCDRLERTGLRVKLLQPTIMLRFHPRIFALHYNTCRTRIIAFTIGSRRPIAVSPAARIDPAEKGHGSYA